MYPKVEVRFYGRGNKPRSIGFMTEKDAINYQYYINDQHKAAEYPAKHIKSIERFTPQGHMVEGLYFINPRTGEIDTPTLKYRPSR